LVRTGGLESAAGFALAAQGITGGCGGGTSAPLLNVTRERMAVFLAVAFMHLH
jgi:hypothetical protein